MKKKEVKMSHILFQQQQKILLIWSKKAFFNALGYHSLGWDTIGIRIRYFYILSYGQWGGKTKQEI